MPTSQVQRTEVSILLYSSEFSWSSQPWRILKWSSTLPSSAGSWACAGWRGPKSLFARASPGLAEFVVLSAGRAVAVGGRTSRWAAAEDVGREGVVSCDGRASRGARAAATASAMSAGVCEASGLGRGWPAWLAVLMMSSGVK